MSIGRHIVVTFTVQIMTALQALVVMPILIRTSGVGTYGAFVMWPTTLGLIFAFSYFGVGYNYRRRLASTFDPAGRRSLFEPQLTYQLCTLAALLALLWLGVQLLGNRLTPAARAPGWILASWLAAQLLFFQAQEFYRNSGRFGPYNFLNAAYAILFVVAIGVGAALHFPMAIGALLLLTVACRVVVSVPLIARLVSEIGLPRLRLPMRALAADILLGWPLLLDTIFTLALAFGDRYLIALFLSIDDVGRYQPGYQLALLLVFIPRSAEVMLMPTLSRMVDANDQEGAQRVVDQFLQYFCMIALPFAVGALLLGPSLVTLLATANVAEASRWVVPFVALGAAFYGISLVFFQVAYVLGTTNMVFIANLLGAIVNIGLNLVLLPITHSITACAVATFLSYAIACLYVGGSLRSRWRTRLDARKVLRYAIATVTMGAVLWLLGFRPGEVSYLSAAKVVGATAVGVIVYMTGLLLVGGLEIAEIAGIFHSIVRGKGDGVRPP